jgi:hypothetical protein
LGGRYQVASPDLRLKCFFQFQCTQCKPYFSCKLNIQLHWVMNILKAESDVRCCGAQHWSFFLEHNCNSQQLWIRPRRSFLSSQVLPYKQGRIRQMSTTYLSYHNFLSVNFIKISTVLYITHSLIVSPVEIYAASEILKCAASFVQLQNEWRIWSRGLGVSSSPLQGSNGGNYSHSTHRFTVMPKGPGVHRSHTSSHGSFHLERI